MKIKNSNVIFCAKQTYSILNVITKFNVPCTECLYQRDTCISYKSCYNNICRFPCNPRNSPLLLFTIGALDWVPVLAKPLLFKITVFKAGGLFEQWCLVSLIYLHLKYFTCSFFSSKGQSCWMKCYLNKTKWCTYPIRSHFINLSVIILLTEWHKFIQ